MNVLFVGSHADDCEVSSGGTISRLWKEGAAIDILLICNLSRIKDISLRIEEAEKAAKVLGADLEVIDLQESRFVGVPKTELVSKLDEYFSKKPYERVFVPCHCDSHQDHEFVARVLFSVCRKNTCGLLAYEAAIPSGIVPNPFILNYFVDISDEMDSKLEALHCHKSQIEAYGEGWISSIVARNRFWGEKFKRKYIEAFQAIKIIV